MKTRFISKSRLAKLTNDFNEMDKFQQLAPANITPSKSVVDSKNGTIGGLSALQQAIDRSLACNAATQRNIDKCKAMLR